MSAETELLYEYSELKRKLAKAREALDTARSHLRDLPRSATADRIDSIIGQALKEIGE